MLNGFSVESFIISPFELRISPKDRRPRNSAGFVKPNDRQRVVGRIVVKSDQQLRIFEPERIAYAHHFLTVRSAHLLTKRPVDLLRSLPEVAGVGGEAFE